MQCNVTFSHSELSNALLYFFRAIRTKYYVTSQRSPSSLLYLFKVIRVILSFFHPRIFGAQRTTCSNLSQSSDRIPTQELTQLMTTLFTHAELSLLDFSSTHSNSHGSLLFFQSIHNYVSFIHSRSYLILGPIYLCRATITMSQLHTLEISNGSLLYFFSEYYGRRVISTLSSSFFFAVETVRVLTGRYLLRYLLGNLIRRLMLEY